MIFEWDPEKSEATRRQRGFGFDFAARIFAGPILERSDDRFEYGEARFQAIGQAEGTILFVVYADRGEARRIISARKATREERRQWLRFVSL